MSKQRIRMCHPDWTGASFEDAYELSAEVVVSVDGAVPRRVVLGDAACRTCTWCGQHAPDTPFVMEAHTIPAAFGNRHHLSNEECDVCNRRFGAELDQALMNWLEGDRLFAGVRRRKGHASVKVKASDGSSVSFSQETQNIALVASSEGVGDGVAYELIRDERELRITIPGRPFAWEQALRGIARMAWLVLPPEERLACTVVRQFALGELDRHPPRFFFHFFAPAAARIVRLRVWRSRTDAVPCCVVAFDIGSYTYIWSAPSVSGTTLPGPLPTYVCDTSLGNPSLTMNSFRSDAIAHAGRQTFSFGFDSLEEGDGIGESPRTFSRKQPRPKADVVFSWRSHDNQASELAAIFTLQRFDERGRRYHFGGKQLHAELVIHDDIERNRTTINIALRMAHAPVDEAMATLGFICALGDGRGTVQVAQAGTSEPFIEFGNVRLDSNWIRSTETQLLKLVGLQRRFGVILTVPDEKDDSSWRIVEILTLAARNDGRVCVRSRNDRFQFDCLQPQEAALRELPLASGVGLEFDAEWTWTVDGTEIPAGRVRVVLHKPRIVGRQVLDNHAELRLDLTCESFTCVFHVMRLSERSSDEEL